MEYQVIKKIVEDYINENWSKVAIFMFTSIGFPFNVFKIKFESLNLIEQFAFINKYEKKLKLKQWK